MKSFQMLVALCLAAVLGGMTAEARTLTENEARQVASQFFTSQGSLVTDTPQAVRADARHAPGRNGQATPAYYVFNNSDGALQRGFVIVSGDDRAVPVLGYSDTGTYDPANVPPAMQEWLDYLSAEIAALGGDETVTCTPQRALGGKIAPLLTCNWDQNEPYNAELPNTSNGNRAATGCVATAMAQAMYYYRWPDNSSAIPEYTTKTQSIYRPALPATTFDWSNMQDNYNKSSTGAPASAVAHLLLYCCQAVDMDFKDGTSSASTSDIPEAFQTYFVGPLCATCELHP